MEKISKTIKKAWSWFFGYSPSVVAKVIGFRLLEVVLVLSFVACGVFGSFVAIYTNHYWITAIMIVTMVVIVRLIYHVDIKKDDWEYDHL